MYYVPHIILNMKKALENMNKLLYAISDLHIGDGSEADDFKHNLTAFNEFLDKTNNDCARLILLGDIFELWQYRFDNIHKAYYNTINNMFNLTDFYIIGNHDQSIPTLITMPNIRTRLLYQSCLFTHGNEYDKYNDWGSSIGKRITSVWTYIEKILPCNDIVEHLWRSDNEQYYNKLYADMIEAKATTAVFGHTHKRSSCEYRGKTIINAGCWTEDDLNYVKIQHGEAVLINWRS